MKKIILLITISLLLTGCFKDKSEIAIKNCADSDWSEYQVEKYGVLFYIDHIYTMDDEPRNIFDETLSDLKRAGVSYKEAQEWAYGLKTAEIEDGNRKVINFFIEEKKRFNNYMEEHFKLPLSDRLQTREYETAFSLCEQEQKEGSKTFDAKWQKAVIQKVYFR